MAGAYLSIPRNRDYSFSSNVAARLADVGNNLTGATLYFVAKVDPDNNTDTAVVFNLTSANGVSANTSSNIITVSINASLVPSSYNVASWEISCVTANAKFYTLDHGLLAITQPVKLTQ